MQEKQRTVVTVLGQDQPGIIYHVSRVLYEHQGNILDVSQSIVGELFNMVMIVELLDPSLSFEQLSDDLNALGETLQMQVKIQRMDIFDAMHRL